MSFDHYVPQFYLQGFKIESSKQSIFVYKKGAEIDQKNIEKIGGLSGYESGEIKDFFKKKDNEWSEVFRKLLESQDKFSFLNEKSIHSLAEFMAFLLCRTPKFLTTLSGYKDAIDTAGEFLKESKRDHVRGLIRDNCTKKEAIKKSDHAFRFPRKLLASIEPKKLESDLKQACNLAEQLIPHLLNRMWTLLDGSSSKNSFITSDHPVSLRGFGEVYFSLQDQILKSQIFLPISPRYAVLATPFQGSPLLMHQYINDEDIDEFNMIMIRYSANTEIYSHESDVRIKKLFDAAEDHEGVKWKWISDDDWRN